MVPFNQKARIPVNMKELDRQALKAMFTVQDGYHYTGTVNVWTEENGIVNSEVVQAWNELQDTPSYFERFKDGREQFDVNE
jgi:hypothetical protein